MRRGDRIWADKRYNCPGCKQGVHRGDIAVFAYPNDRSVRYIKRVIGLPGDQIQLKDRQVWVNGQPLQAAVALLAASRVAGTTTEPTEPTGGIHTPQTQHTTETIDGRTWQVQWSEPAVPPESTTARASTQTPSQTSAPTPTLAPAMLPPLNRAQTVAATELKLTVPDGQVFVLGDNRQNSVDSRNFGTVPMQDVLGRARQVWFSADGNGVRWERLGQVLR